MSCTCATLALLRTMTWLLYISSFSEMCHSTEQKYAIQIIPITIRSSLKTIASTKKLTLQIKN